MSKASVLHLLGLVESYFFFLFLSVLIFFPFPPPPLRCHFACWTARMDIFDTLISSVAEF